MFDDDFHGKEILDLIYNESLSFSLNFLDITARELLKQVFITDNAGNINAKSSEDIDNEFDILLNSYRNSTLYKGKDVLSLQSTYFISIALNFISTIQPCSIIVGATLMLHILQFVCASIHIERSQTSCLIDLFATTILMYYYINRQSISTYFSNNIKCQQNVKERQQETHTQ